MTALKKALVWIWSKIRAAAVWLWENPVALAGLAGTALGAWLMWKSKKNQIATLEDAATVQALRGKIAKDEARAELLEKQAESKEPEAERLKVEIAESKRRVLEIHQGEKLETLSDDEIAKKFSESGL